MSAGRERKSRPRWARPANGFIRYILRRLAQIQRPPPLRGRNGPRITTISTAGF